MVLGFVTRRSVYIGHLPNAGVTPTRLVRLFVPIPTPPLFERLGRVVRLGVGTDPGLKLFWHRDGFNDFLAGIKEILRLVGRCRYRMQVQRIIRITFAKDHVNHRSASRQTRQISLGIRAIERQRQSARMVLDRISIPAHFKPVSRACARQHGHRFPGIRRPPGDARQSSNDHAKGHRDFFKVLHVDSAPVSGPDARRAFATLEGHVAAIQEPRGEKMTPKLLLCDCAGSQTLDGTTIEQATGLSCGKIATGLCGPDLERVMKALETGDTIIACAQETAIFEQLAEETGVQPALSVDIRDRAGWSEDGADATPKMAALLAEALLEAPAHKTFDIVSEGLTLVIGPEDVALPVALQLSATQSVTCLITDPGDTVPTLSRDIDVIAGAVRGASGALGRFELRIDALRRVDPAGRGELRFTAPRDGAGSECDVILDLSGAAPLFPAPAKRDGYFRADPGDPQSVARAAFDTAQATGTFEKPFHIRFTETLCAHSRAEQTACTRCLDLCPTGAITPAGEHVSIDPNVCAGCGACASVCPTGAAAYDDPPVGHVFRRLTTMSETYQKAGGTKPRLLVHDPEHGREMIALAARHGRGLPANVIPFEMTALNAFGHAEALAALGRGFADVTILPTPRTERDPLSAEIALANTIAGRNRVRLLDTSDPDAMSDDLFGGTDAEPVASPILPIGGRREVTRLAAKALGATGAVSLPEGAPYGGVALDLDACTLCLSCASLCPPGALTDNPDRPELLFREDACVQCGLCTSVCPENAISLVPQLNLDDNALSEQVLKEEEPFACIECGALFGVKSTIERITETLAGKHSMFTNSDNAKLIQMCDDCRVKVQFKSTDNPFAMGTPPRVRTTDDYN